MEQGGACDGPGDIRFMTDEAGLRALPPVARFQAEAIAGLTARILEYRGTWAMSATAMPAIFKREGV